VDIYSGLVHAEPIDDASAAQMAAAFRRSIIIPFGVPKYVRVDGGREFLASFATLAAGAGVTVKRGRRDVHTGQQRVERAHRTLRDVVARMRLNDQLAGRKLCDLDYYVQRAVAAANAAPSLEASHLSPFELFHGRSPVVPPLAVMPAELLQAAAVDAPPAVAQQLADAAQTRDAIIAANVAQRARLREARRKHAAADIERRSADPWVPAVGDLVAAQVLVGDQLGDKDTRRRLYSGPWIVLKYDPADLSVKMRLPIPMRHANNSDRFMESTTHVRHVRRYYIDDDEPGEPIEMIVYNALPRALVDADVNADARRVVLDRHPTTTPPPISIQVLLDALTNDGLRKRFLAAAKRLGYRNVGEIQQVETAEGALALRHAKRVPAAPSNQQATISNTPVSSQSSSTPSAPAALAPLLPSRPRIARIVRLERDRSTTIIHGQSANGGLVSARIDSLDANERQLFANFSRHLFAPPGLAQ
jgi:hypothetical protein